MRDVVIVDNVRTGLAKAFRGSFNLTRSDDMLAHCIDALLDRNPKVSPDEVEDVVVGCASHTGEQDGNIARLAVVLSRSADHDGGSVDQPFLFIRSAIDRDRREPDCVGSDARRDRGRRRFDLDAAAPGSGQVETEQASRRREARNLHGDGQHRRSSCAALSGDARDAGRVRAAESAAICESSREGLHRRRNRADESHDEPGRQEDRRREAGRSDRRQRRMQSSRHDARRSRETAARVRRRRFGNCGQRIATVRRRVDDAADERGTRRVNSV